MAVKTTEQLINETLQALNTLLDPSVTRTSADITAIIKACFKTAFTQKDIDKKALYRKLSAEVHPDKLLERHPTLHTYLAHFNLVSELQQSLNVYNNKNDNIMSDVFNHPVKGSQRLLTYLLEKFNPIFTASQRYIEPFKTIGNVISSLINIALAVPIIVFLFVIVVVNTAIALPIKILSSFLSFMLKKQLGPLYEAHMNDDEVKACATKNYLSQVRMASKMAQPDAAQTIDALDDEAYMALVKAELTQMEIQNGADEAQAEVLAKTTIDQKIYALSKPSNSLEVTWFAQALYTTLTPPLPEAIIDRIAAIVLIRPLKFLLGITFLPAIATLEALRVINGGLLAAAIGLAILSKVASLVIINTPLYIYDAVRKPQSTSSDDSAIHSTGSSHGTVLGLLRDAPELAKVPTRAEEPMQTGSLFPSANPDAPGFNATAEPANVISI